MSKRNSSQLPKVGDKVYVEKQHGKDKGQQLTGSVQYIGVTKFDVGLWIGVRLNKPVGRNDGSVRGVKYFQCPPNYGLFSRPENVFSLGAVRKGPAKKPVASPGARSGRLAHRTRSIDNPEYRMSSTDVKYLRRLAETNPEKITEIDPAGNTRLHHMAKGQGRDCISAIKYLLKNGLSQYMHHVNNASKTAVILAAEAQNWEVVEFLVSVGADIIYKGEKDDLPSAWELCQETDEGAFAIQNGLAKYYSGAKSNRIPGMRHKMRTINRALFQAVDAGDLEFTKMLVLNRSAKINVQDQDGNTPLHICAESNNGLPVCQFLTNNGGKIHVKNNVRDTAVLIAARNKAWRVMKHLVSVGASVSEKDQSGTNVLKYAQFSAGSRKALADGMAECKRNEQKHRLDHIDQRSTLSDSASEVDSEFENEESEVRSQIRWDENANEVKEFSIADSDAEEMLVQEQRRRRNSVEDVTPVLDKSFGLEEVLSIPSCRAVLHAYMQSQWCEENINFLEAIEGYQNMFPDPAIDDDEDEADLEQAQRIAESIFDEFVAQGAPQMVALSADIAQNIEKRVVTKDFARDLFDESGRQVFDMVDNNTFQRFVKSEEYRRMMSNPDIQDAVEEIQAIKASVAREFEMQRREMGYEGSEVGSEVDPGEFANVAPPPKQEEPADLDMSNIPMDCVDVSVLKQIMKDGNAAGRDEHGNTRLHAISEKHEGSGAIAALDFLLKHGLITLLHSANNEGLSAVMCAARAQHWEVVAFLIADGADIIDKGASEELPSVWDLSRKDDYAMAAVSRGIELQRQARAASGGELPCPDMKHKASLYAKTLFRAATSGDLEFARMLIEDRGVPVDVVDKDGNSPLHYLARNPKNMKVLQYCIASNANVSLKNKEGHTPCVVAAECKAWACMQQLIKAGASVSEKDKSGKSVFKFAQESAESRRALADGLQEQRENRDRSGSEPGEPGAPQAAAVKQPSPKLEPAEVKEEPKKKSRSPVGTYDGECTGKKKDKRKEKKCQVIISNTDIEIRYKKGSFYSRKEIVEHYPYAKDMIVNQADPYTLLVLLDSNEQARLKISNCHAGHMEKFIAERISMAKE